MLLRVDNEGPCTGPELQATTTPDFVDSGELAVMDAVCEEDLIVETLPCAVCYFIVPLPILASLSQARLKT